MQFRFFALGKMRGQEEHIILHSVGKYTISEAENIAISWVEREENKNNDGYIIIALRVDPV